MVEATVSALSNVARRNDFVPWSAQSTAQDIPTVVDGKGVYFWDSTGKRYLDFSSQLANTNLGHQHPRLVEAVKRQAERLCFIAPHFSNEPRERAAAMLAEIAPGDINTTFFSTSGSEANEFALALARLFTGRGRVLARHRSYHGTSAGTLGVSGDPRRIASHHNLSGAVRFFPPYCYRCSFGLTYPECSVQCARSLEETILYEGADGFAAIIVEPITGANGPFVPPPEYYGLLREICDKHGILLIADEVITGFGRTGKWFGIEHWGVVPDMITVSKGLNGGVLPLGAVLMRDGIAAHFDEQFVPVGSTQTGSPLSCAAAIAAIETYREEHVVENAARLGEYLMDRLRELQDRHPSVGDVRGLGLIASIELVADRETREPLIPWNAQTELLGRIKKMFADRGLHILMKWNWLMIAPPLIITRDEVDEGIAAIDEVLCEVEASL